MMNHFARTTREFASRVAVVTGGTDGLGRDLVGALVTQGAHVFFCGRDPRKGRAVTKALGRRAHFVACDLQDPSATIAFVRAAGSFRGRIDYLVNNAANDPRIPFAKATLAEFDRLIAINLRSYFVVAQAALPYLKRGEGKAVVNISTTNYMLGLTPFTVYNTSKSGIIGFARSLARELGPLGIRVNTLSPGWIMTPKQLREHVTRRDQKQLIADQCLKRLMTGQDVTPATLFLLSSLSRGVTGQNLIVDGGKVHS